jgi:predicted ATPase
VLGEAKEASQERRKREVAVFLHEVSRRRPLVIFLDDIHWADPSSVDLLAYLGSKSSEWRFLLLLAYRHTDLLRTQHPFGPVKLELQGRGDCREIALPFLSRDDFDRYLELAFVGHRFPEELAAILHTRTEGNPLFMVDLVRYLRDRGVIVQDQGHWSLLRRVPDLQHELPESIRAMIQRKLDQLSTADRHLLMAGSVFGLEFGSVGTSQVLGREPADVEERLAVLETVHGMVQRVGERTLPDGLVTVRYAFVHALYQNALYAALQPTRKASWSAAAAQALLDHYGEKSGDRAADLAVLFEAARDPERAADHYLIAAENAARVFAHREAIVLARRGLSQLGHLPNTPERAALELPLRTTLGLQLQVTQGYAAPEAEEAYSRARGLCQQDADSLFPVLWGLWLISKVRSELPRAREMAKELLEIAQRTEDSALALQAHQALGMTAFCHGRPADAVQHVEQAIALYDPSQHAAHAFQFGQDPAIISKAFGAVALWLLGYPDRARRQSAATIAASRKLSPSSQAVAFHFAAVLQQLLRDGPRTRSHAAASSAIAAEHGFSFWLAGALVLDGWGLAVCGEIDQGVCRLRQGIADWAATGSVTYQTYYLGLLAEALAAQGQQQEAERVLNEAMALVRQTGEELYEAQLYRLRGLLRINNTTGPEALRQAEEDFYRALTITRQQEAKSMELRALMSLTRLYQKHNRQTEARPMLSECYDWFTEGFDTRDLQEAKALLEQIS